MPGRERERESCKPVAQLELPASPSHRLSQAVRCPDLVNSRACLIFNRQKTEDTFRRQALQRKDAFDVSFAVQLRNISLRKLPPTVSQQQVKCACFVKPAVVPGVHDATKAVQAERKHPVRRAAVKLGRRKCFDQCWWLFQ